MDFSSSLFSYLASVTLRSSLLVALAAIAIPMLRVKTAVVRHAIWAVATVGMLLTAALLPVLPALRLPVLPAGEGLPAFSDLAGPAISVASRHVPGRIPNTVAATVSSPWPSWKQAMASLYGIGAAFLLGRLLFGYLFTRRLLRASRPVTLSGELDVSESAWINVPMTVGWLRPRILLPAGWDTWSRAKLDAVLAHERTHIHRSDWAIAVLAGLNRCLFWFNPVTWWLERRLSVLAELACDDGALAVLGTRDSYAQALLDMAATVKSGQGRLIWEATAMARTSDVKTRIERILDETRQLPQGLTRVRGALLVLCSLPVIWAAAALRPVPVAAQQLSPAVVASDLASPAEISALEQKLTIEPGDARSRSRLLGLYMATGDHRARMKHVLWLIENQPDSELNTFNVTFVPGPGAGPSVAGFDVAEYERARSLWQLQAATHSKDAKVLANAARFFKQSAGDWREAERLYERARADEPENRAIARQLADLYCQAITSELLNKIGRPQLSGPSGFATWARTRLDTSSDGAMLFEAGMRLRGFNVVPPPSMGNPPEFQLQELSQRLLARAAQFGVTSPAAPPPPLVVAGPGRGVPGGVPGGVSAGVPGGVSRGVPGGLASSRDANPNRAVRLSVAPQPISSNEPVYPPLARQARLSGVVQLDVTIGTDGRVTNISAKGHPLLTTAAIEAVRTWVYAPVVQNGAPVVAAFEVPVTFQASSLGPMAAMKRFEDVRNDLQNRSAPPAPDGVQPQPPVPSRIRIGAGVAAMKVIHRVEPNYPPLAVSARIEGDVKLTVTIARDGHVLRVDAVPNEGHPLLVPAAIEAVKQWIYDPTQLNGVPVEVETTVELAFRL